MAKFGSIAMARSNDAMAARVWLFSISGMTRRVALKSSQRRSGGLFRRAIWLLNRVARFSQLAAHVSRGGSYCVQHLLFILGLDLLPCERCTILTTNCL